MGYITVTSANFERRLHLNEDAIRCPQMALDERVNCNRVFDLRLIQYLLEVQALMKLE